eukprot:3843163-Prymnesium_polylepis.1
MSLHSVSKGSDLMVRNTDRCDRTPPRAAGRATRTTHRINKPQLGPRVWGTRPCPTSRRSAARGSALAVAAAAFRIQKPSFSSRVSSA